MLIKDVVEQGIPTLDELKEALQLALQLEFATIPPYLCAQWSIKSDPDRVESVIHRVVSEEMSHMGLVGNLLSSIGGTPALANASFVPLYPTHTLPGCINQRLAVGLQPLSLDQLAVFMQIEYPNFPPVALEAGKGPATVGEFYDTLIEAFRTLGPKIDPGAHRVPIADGPPLGTLDDAIAMLEKIKSEGEGVEDSPEQPTSHKSALAHYYAFKEIFKQQKLVETDGKWTFTGARITFPDVYCFANSRDTLSASAEFNRVFSKLLSDLEASWTCGIPLDIAAMFQVKIIGTELIRRGVTPEFKWLEPKIT